MILHLIKALYDPRIPLPRDPVFYEKSLVDIEYFNVFSQIYFLLKQQGKLEQTPSFFQKRLEQKYKEALYPNILIKSQTERLLKKFEEAGISVIPLKGISFAEKYFGHVGARGTSDIDLLIKPLDLEKAIDCVKSTGFTIEQVHIPSHFHWSFSKLIPNSTIPLTVELHWHLLKDNTSDLSMNEFWNQAKPVYSFTHIKELSDFHTFYMICLHGWRHNLDSLKYFLDIIQMIHSVNQKFDYNDLFKQAAGHNTLRRITRTLAIVYYHFPHLELIKELPLQKRTRLWWNYKAIRDSKYKPIEVYLNFIYYEFFDFDTIKHSIAALFSFLFPKKSNMNADNPSTSP
jgi:hypothetical protein